MHRKLSLKVSYDLSDEISMVLLMPYPKRSTAVLKTLKSKKIIISSNLLNLQKRKEDRLRLGMMLAHRLSRLYRKLELSA